MEKRRWLSCAFSAATKATVQAYSITSGDFFPDLGDETKQGTGKDSW